MTRNRPLRRASHRPSRLGVASLGLLALSVCGSPRPAQAQALDPGRPEIAQFIAEVSHRHGFEPGPLAATFAQLESRPAILQAISRPAERTLKWDEYRGKFLTERRIGRGVAVHAERRAELEQAEKATGVPAGILLAIVGVETLYGENTGKYRVADALATLAFDYPPRAPFFRGELEQFLLMTREEGLDPLAPLGSYAGAMGIPQFMPTSFRKWAVDGDGDGVRDLWNDWADVFASVGNYLKAHGWEPGGPVMVPADASGADLAGVEFGKIGLPETVGSLRKRGVRFETSLPDATPATLVALAVGFGNEYRVGLANFHAITRYNRSHMYASAVNDLAEAIGAALAAGASAPAQVPPAPVDPAS
ncbi:MAG TPA: lytic murein transglycosylase B [Steroidobacteraceae bacterium]|nr:lytic murein transglycosylase B [Steroidobacteraceae bacterium]